MDDYLIGTINFIHMGRGTCAKQRLVFTFLLACVASFTVGRASSATPAVGVDEASPASAPPPASVAPVSSSPATPAPVASTPQNTTLVADNQAVGNATPAA